MHNLQDTISQLSPSNLYKIASPTIQNNKWECNAVLVCSLHASLQASILPPIPLCFWHCVAISQPIKTSNLICIKDLNSLPHASELLRNSLLQSFKFIMQLCMLFQSTQQWGDCKQLLCAAINALHWCLLYQLIIIYSSLQFFLH